MFTLVTYIIFENVTSFVSFFIQDLIQLACQLLKQPQLCQEFWESVSTSFSVFVGTVFLRQKKLSLICVPYFCCNIKEDYPQYSREPLTSCWFSIIQHGTIDKLLVFHNIARNH